MRSYSENKAMSTSFSEIQSAMIVSNSELECKFQYNKFISLIYHINVIRIIQNSLYHIYIQISTDKAIKINKSGSVKLF